jgi:hypothetical protein
MLLLLNIDNAVVVVDHDDDGGGGGDSSASLQLYHYYCMSPFDSERMADIAFLSKLVAQVPVVIVVVGHRHEHE